jgi:RNA-binding protein
MSDSEKSMDSGAAVPSALKGSDRKYLRGLAHTLTPVVRIGNAGLTDRVIDATEQALDAHELIKVKIAADRDERKAAAVALAENTRSELAGIVGRIAILYRPAADPKRRAIVLPSSPGDGSEVASEDGGDPA